MVDKKVAAPATSEPGSQRDITEEAGYQTGGAITRLRSRVGILEQEQSRLEIDYKEADRALEERVAQSVGTLRTDYERDVSSLRTDLTAGDTASRGYAATQAQGAETRAKSYTDTKAADERSFTQGEVRRLDGSLKAANDRIDELVKNSATTREEFVGVVRGTLSELQQEAGRYEARMATRYEQETAALRAENAALRTQVSGQERRLTAMASILVRELGINPTAVEPAPTASQPPANPGTPPAGSS